MNWILCEWYGDILTNAGCNDRPSNFELNKTMIKKSFLALFAVLTFSCGVYGQGFTTIAPSDLGFSTASGPIDGIFDIGLELGEANDSDVTLEIDNGFVSSLTDSWTVGEGNSTSFILGGPSAVDVFVNHGRNLGSENFANGSDARDGITSASGETWSLDTGTLDTSRYTFGQNANDYFVDYTGTETDQLEFNPVGFRFASDQPVSTWTVFSSNTVDLDNNYSLGFRAVTAIPEPAAGMLLAFAGVFLVRRKRS